MAFVSGPSYKAYAFRLGSSCGPELNKFSVTVLNNVQEFMVHVDSLSASESAT